MSANSADELSDSIPLSAVSDELQAPLLAHRLVALERELEPSTSSTSSSSSHSAGAAKSPTVSTDDGSMGAEQQQQQFELMMTALKTPASGGAAGHSSPTAMHARRINGQVAAAAPASDGEDEEDDDDVEHEQRLYTRKSPQPESSGKGTAAKQTELSPAERARITRNVLDSLNKGPTRAFPFGEAEQAALSEAIRERALENEVALQYGGAAKDVKLQSASEAVDKKLSKKDAVAYLTSTPLLYADSLPISSPHPNAPVFARNPIAKRVYQQAIQALYVYSAGADFVRHVSPEAQRRAEARASVRVKLAAARGVSVDDLSDSDEDEEAAAGTLSSRTLDAAAAAKAKNAAAPLSPLDPAHPTLKPLLLAVEAAFDMPDRTTKSHAEPFRSSMRSTLQLSKSLLRMHQTRLDTHPTHTQDAFDDARLFSVWFARENAGINERMNDIEQQLQFEATHRREGEESTSKPTSDAAAGGGVNKVKQKAKKSFWSCCTSTMDEPDIEADARMQSKPAIAAAGAGAASSGEADASVVLQWEKDDFDSNFNLLLCILLQYGVTLDAELDREEAAEREKQQRRQVNPAEIRVEELKNPNDDDDAAVEEKKEESKGNDADEDEHAHLYTSRTVNENRIRALDAVSLQLLHIYAEVWRVGKPLTSTRTLALLANNLNFNEPAFYSLCTNQLSAAATLYKGHMSLLSGSAGVKRAIPFTKAELFAFQRSVRDLYEWVAISLQRYQMVFSTDAAEEPPLDGDEEAGDAQDGLRECLFLFDTLTMVMRELHLPAHTSAADAEFAPPASAAVPHPVDILKRLIEQAIAARYQRLVSSAVSSASSTDVADANSVAIASGALSPVPDSDSHECRVQHVSQLSALLKAVSADVLLDMQKSEVFREVIKDERVSATGAEATDHVRPPRLQTSDGEESGVSVAARASPLSHLPSAINLANPRIHQAGFDLAQVSAATFLTYVWRDTQQFMRQTRARFEALNQLPHRNNAQANALRTLNAQLPLVVRLHSQLADLYALVARSVPNLPGLRVRVQSWWEWVVSAWLAKTYAEWAAPPASADAASSPGAKLAELLESDTFSVNLGESNVRYSSSVVGLFGFLQPLAHMFKATPYSQRNVEELAKVITAVISSYVRALHADIVTVLQREAKKGIMFGAEQIGGKGAEVELSIPPSLFVRLNDMQLCKSQLQLLLDEIKLPQAWSSLLLIDGGSQSGSAAAAGDSSPAVQRSVTSPGVARSEVPTSQEKKASHAQLARDPAPSPVSPFPSPPPSSPSSSQLALPPSVQNLLECRSAFDSVSRSIDDLLLRMTAGLGVFSEHHIQAVIEREIVEEWTGRHTKEEIEPLLSYLQRHLDHMRMYVYDTIFTRQLFFLISDIVLILEKELVHPKRQLYKNRLRTEQVHRVIQIHYILADFFETDCKLTADYMARLKVSHLIRLEFLETLLTGGSDGLIAEFNRLNEAEDAAQHALSFAARESQRLLKPPYLSRRQLAGIIKFRAEFEGDNTVHAFLKKHASGWFSSNYFQ